jgi:integrase
VAKTSESVLQKLSRSEGQLQLRATTLGEALNALLAETASRVQGGVRSPATLGMQRQHVRYLLERVPAGLPVVEIDEETIDELATAEGGGRRKRVDGSIRPIAASSILKRLSTLRRALKLQKRRRVIDRLPEFPEILSEYRPDRKFIRSHGEALAIAAALPSNRADWFWLALWTGQHSSDVERMTREDINPAGADRWVRVRNTKNRRFEGLRIACPAELARAFGARWLALRPGAALVEKWPHVTSQLPDTCARIGLPRYSAKTLRHTFFTWMISRVGITKAVMEIGGWSSYEMIVRVYGHALPPQFRDAVRALDRLVIDEARRPPRSAKRSPSGLQAPSVTAGKLAPAVLQAPRGPKSQLAEGAAR